MPFSAMLCSCNGDPAESSDGAAEGESEYHASLDESKAVGESSEIGEDVSDDTSENGESDESEENGDTSQSGEGNDSPSNVQKDYPTLCGGFMQPNAFVGYSQAQMESHLQTMYDVGIDILILQWSFNTEGGKVKSVYFESDFADSEYASDCDKSGEKLLETILSAAEKVGVKVFIGLNDNAEWWQKGVYDRAWLERESDFAARGAKQMYDKYKSSYPNAFYGWYFVFEFYNMQANDTVVENAAYLLNLCREPLYSIDKEMPMMLSPYISSAGASPEETGRLWSEVFAKTNFKKGDIFCCQDSVGAGHITMDMLDSYYAAIKQAVDSKEGLLFWANNENFTQSDWTTAPLDRFIEQLKISDKYVSAHITFAYSHYQHPDVQKLGHHLAYAEYYKTGKLPQCTLSAPEAQFSVANGGNNVTISMTAKNKDNTFLGLRVYKNDSLISFVRFENQYGKPEYRYTLSDSNIDGNGSAVYRIVSVDYYNNESAPFEYTVNYESKNGKNIALGKSYTSVTPTESNYPDENGKSLTDGKNGIAQYYDPAWNGYLGKAEIAVDLGANAEGVYAVSLTTLGGGSAAVYHPNAVTVYASDDGVSYTAVKTESLGNDLSVDSLFTKKHTIALAGEIDCRYVKIAVSTNQSWIFIDEIEILA